MKEGRKKPQRIEKVRTLLKAVKKSQGLWMGCTLRCTGLLKTVCNGSEEIRNKNGRRRNFKTALRGVVESSVLWATGTANGKKTEVTSRRPGNVGLRRTD